MKTKKSLFDIAEDVRLLEESLFADPDQEEVIKEFLADANEELERKLDGYAELIAEVKARITARKERAKEIQALVKSDEALVERLTKTLQWFFETNELKKVETDRHRISLAKNGGKVPVVFAESFDVAELPEAFVVTKLEVNKEAVREALESGQELNFATLGDRGQSIRVK
ncbi:MAG: siphovirus Gp157 family protein [bacterium]